MATPFDGTMSPAGYYTGNNGYMSPPAMMTPANGYMSHAGSACMSPNGFHQQQLQQQQQMQQRDYPVETRTPRSTGGEWRAMPHQPEYLQQQPGRCGASVAPFGASSGTCVGYKWEECYAQLDGKKFWRHRETGVILKKDPYR